MFLLPLSLVLSILLVVILTGLRDSYNNRYKPHGFDPSAKYSNGTHEFYPITLVLSLDGFHPSLISKEATPFLHELYTLQQPNTSVAPFIVPSFPSQTFPNHWSIVTGKYPSENGIVANWFWDHSLEKQFGPGNIDPELWETASEPIWSTLENAFFADTFKSAAHMWPGCEVQGRTPHFFTAFNDSETLEEKSESIFRNYVDGKRDASERPQLILAYAPQPDAYGHEYGYPAPHTPSFRELLNKIDSYVSRVFAALDQRHMRHFTNVVILSDHGMATVPSHNVLLEKEILPDDLRTQHVSHSYLEGPALAIYTPNASHVERQLIKRLERLKIGKNFHVTRNLQQEFGYKLSGERTADIWVLPDVHYAVAHQRRLLGTHGYNNSSPEMRALFIANGPAFTEGYVEPFENVAIHGLLLELAGWKSEPHVGRPSHKIATADTKPQGLLVPLRSPPQDDLALLSRIFGNGSSYNAVFHNETTKLDAVVPEKQQQDFSSLLGEIVGELQAELAEWGSNDK
ncbi:ZYRO0E03564p [Zygosaccharomyces rouxii]|uniref:ZYRO0E03564p n=2 Tax=Zygosaccharomyces rouxii TaxID=4956 RepID=C5E478_ZYGRC|nr:uncharacterized protein ZYRO0E03564g [Zygosaccharomyces rouxii]KAH9198303.1 Ectonucleotide pyrophosphatase [Zygosaccharomyces rouxii]CAQ43479.1 Ectonucleotide pyrophosphatase/phosphodiesterase 1 and Ectonucleotide pyrophosphatase/phosphodiesterase 2 [Zygosaccharomyces rouxii]CAR30839.1 ZYRO0E03564p [Zygosaccharomyces rouxii]